MVLPGYFETMQVPLLSGRTFEDRDNESVQAVAIIDETLARQAWPDGDAVGQRLRIGLGTVLENPEVEVIGVVRHSRIIDVRHVVRPQIYLPWRLGPGPNLTFTLRTDTDPASLLPAVRSALEEVGTGRPIHTVLTMGEAVEGAMGATRFTLVLMGLLAAIALLLATVGVYSLIAFIARQRTHETGIRMALGAGRSDILGSNLREGLILVAVGLPIGLAGAALAARSIRSLLFGVSPIDPVTYAAVPLFLLLVGLSASILPAWQASRVDPAVALRRE
jgi:putative ABC transport system permease protein